MQSIEQLSQIVVHSRMWGLTEHPLREVRLQARPRIEVRRGQLTGFVAWVKTLIDPAVQVFDGLIGDGTIEASGQLSSGLPVLVAVPVNAQRLRAAHLHGVVHLGQIQQFAARQAPEAEAMPV